jgi:hypothetical protein
MNTSKFVLTAAAVTLSFVVGYVVQVPRPLSITDGSSNERTELRQKLNQSAASIAALRGEVAALQAALATQGENAVVPAAPSPPASGPGGPGWQLASDWANRGTATPAAAVETWLWADVNNRPDVWLSAVRFSGVARRKIAAVYQNVPESERLKFPSPEAMFASMSMASHPYSWTGMRVLPPEMQTPESAVVAYEHQWSDGRFRINRIQFHLFSDGWKMPYPDESVDAVLRSYGLGRASGNK